MHLPKFQIYSCQKQKKLVSMVEYCKTNYHHRTILLIHYKSFGEIITTFSVKCKYKLTIYLAFYPIIMQFHTHTFNIIFILHLNMFMLFHWVIFRYIRCICSFHLDWYLLWKNLSIETCWPTVFFSCGQTCWLVKIYKKK